MELIQLRSLSGLPITNGSICVWLCQLVLGPNQYLVKMTLSLLLLYSHDWMIQRASTFHRNHMSLTDVFVFTLLQLLIQMTFNRCT